MSLHALDGNEAAARAAYAHSEVIALYPITPSSTMGEACDAWAAAGKLNKWGKVPRVIEMQSEAGAAGVLHGAAISGALATSFTSSQGLLLMLPELYKLAGEQLPCVLHVAARALATHALSIFGDHSDVMAARGTGAALLASSSVQEAADMALVAHAASLSCRLPFIHFFDGFRTSHEIQTVTLPELDLVDPEALALHRRRGLSPRHPQVRGTAQNPDVFFQSREAAEPLYRAAPAVVQALLDRFGKNYRNFEYSGAPDATHVLVAMGSGAETAKLAVRRLGGKTGVLKVRLYRPFDAAGFVRALPPTARHVVVLDRCKEPGSIGEPLFLDVAAALASRSVRVVGGRYGLSSKEFTPSMAAAALGAEGRFVVGIKDDVSGLSIEGDPRLDAEEPETTRAVFYGLGSDGTVGANKEAVKLLAERAALYAQAYFVYDSKKSGSMTVSHLRFGPRPVNAPFLVKEARFVAVHHPSLWRRADVLSVAAPGAVVLLNAEPAKAWAALPEEARRAVREKGLELWAVDAFALAKQAGLGRRVNTVMQACFFSLTGVLPGWRAALEASVRKAYPRAAEPNLAALAAAESGLRRVPVPDVDPAPPPQPEPLPAEAPAWLHALLAGKGDELPVSALPSDGAFPCATSRLEKRGIAAELPQWDAKTCVQCNKCALICPHACIRPKLHDGSAPLPSAKARSGGAYTLQLSPDDCTGCSLCVEICPVDTALVMRPAEELRDREAANWKVFEKLPDPPREKHAAAGAASNQLIRPLFEFSGACSGCGETPYVKLLTQLFGARLMIANATGCSSIYGGNLPTTPWSVAWANSLFEDNAEFGLGMRLAQDALGDEDSSVWLVGGDGWAYDIGFGGLDHVLRSGERVKALVLDTEVYSNTGGQASKATPRGAVARFAANGKSLPRKDLARYAMTIGGVYVARIALGANDTQAARALLEAESFDGPAIVIAYSPCIAHGVDMGQGVRQQRLAVGCGYWPLLRHDPRKEKPLTLDSRPGANTFEEYIAGQARYRSSPELLAAAKADIEVMWKELTKLAA